jgi:hypothetical protein
MALAVLPGRKRDLADKEDQLRQRPHRKRMNDSQPPLDERCVTCRGGGTLDFHPETLMQRIRLWGKLTFA